MSEIDIIKKETDELLKKLNVSGEAEVIQREDFFSVNIKTEDGDLPASDGGQAGILIGYHGETLQALQLILSLIVSKKVGKFLRLIVNVGDYREKREEKLKEMALDAAHRAKETKQEVILGNLTPWQRRIVHVTLAEDKDVKTESVGEDPDRQLVIKPR